MTNILMPQNISHCLHKMIKDHGTGHNEQTIIVWDFGVMTNPFDMRWPAVYSVT